MRCIGATGVKVGQFLVGLGNCLRSFEWWLLEVMTVVITLRFKRFLIVIENYYLWSLFPIGPNFSRRWDCGARPIRSCHAVALSTLFHYARWRNGWMARLSPKKSCPAFKRIGIKGLKDLCEWTQSLWKTICNIIFQENWHLARKEFLGADRQWWGHSIEEYRRS